MRYLCIFRKILILKIPLVCCIQLQLKMVFDKTGTCFVHSNRVVVSLKETWHFHFFLSTVPPTVLNVRNKELFQNYLSTFIKGVLGSLEVLYKQENLLFIFIEYLIVYRVARLNHHWGRNLQKGEFQNELYSTSEYWSFLFCLKLICFLVLITSLSQISLSLPKVLVQELTTTINFTWEERFVIATNILSLFAL